MQVAHNRKANATSYSALSDETDDKGMVDVTPKEDAK
jgi:hypothetical protein